jgi:hypothetical protein
MTTANAPLTKAVLRSLLWDAGATAAARPDAETTTEPDAESVRTIAPPPQPAPQREIQLDELTLAKMRLLELRRPPASALARVARNPIPWVIAALALGLVLGRSRTARTMLVWAGKKAATGTLAIGARRFASSRPDRSNGRLRAWMKSSS